MRRILILLLVFVIIIQGCGPNIDKKNAEILGKILANEDVTFSDIKIDNRIVTVYYEASNADEYDTQIVADWGSIFGAASNFDYDVIKIVNTVNDVPYVSLSTTKENVLALNYGDINQTVFWENVDIESID